MSAMDDGNKSRAAACLMSATAGGKRVSFLLLPPGRCPRCGLMATAREVRAVMCAGRREQGASSGGTRWGRRRRVAAVKTTRPAMATTGLPVLGVYLTGCLADDQVNRKVTVFDRPKTPAARHG
jgi:hypothetical protein